MNQQYPAALIRSMLILVGMISILVSRIIAPLETWSIVLMIVQLVALDMVLKESTVYRTAYFRVISPLIGILIIGALFKIMHWQWADMLITGSLVGIALTYSLRVIKKTRLRLLDLSKWGWLITGIATSMLFLLHQPYAQLSAYISMGMFFLMMLAFFITPREALHTEHDMSAATEDKPLDQV